MQETQATWVLPGSGGSSGGGNGNPLQYSCLGNPMNRGAWWATAHGFAKSPAGLREQACTRTSLSYAHAFVDQRYSIMTLCLPHQFSSVTQPCPTLCNPMNRSTPGLPVYHRLPELTQTHVHRVSDAIQPSHPLSSSSPPAPSQHQSLFQ